MRGVEELIESFEEGGIVGYETGVAGDEEDEMVGSAGSLRYGT